MKTKPTYRQNVVVSFERRLPSIKQVKVEENRFTQVLDSTWPVQVTCLQTCCHKTTSTHRRVSQCTTSD